MIRPYYHALTLLGAALISLGGCAKSDAGMQPGATQGDEATPAEVNREALDDGQIAKVLQTVDNGEIAQAQVALTKASDTRVRNFATEMNSQHADARETMSRLATQQGIAPTDSAQSKKLKRDGETALTTLNASDAVTFDALYMKGQIEQHQSVLDLLHARLIPAARNAALREQLALAQSMVEHHLAEAKQIAP